MTTLPRDELDLLRVRLQERVREAEAARTRLASLERVVLQARRDVEARRAASRPAWPLTQGR